MPPSEATSQYPLSGSAAIPTTGLFNTLADVATDPAGVNEMVTLNPVRGMLSEMSVAFSVTLSAVLSVTENVAMPLESVVAEAGDRAALADVGKRATIFPARANPLPSFKITTTVALDWPSAGTVVRFATMSESATTGVMAGG